MNKVAFTSLRSSGSRVQFAVAVAMISVIPMMGLVSLFYLGWFDSDADTVISVYIPVVLLFSIMLFGYMILEGYVKNIIRIRSNLEMMARGEIPDKLELLRTENDMVMIERCMRELIYKLKTNLEKAKEDVSALEHELLQAQRLESMGRLTAGVAHEINTPLQFVADNTHFILKSWDQVEEVIVAFSQCVGSLEDVRPDLFEKYQLLRTSLDMEFIETEIPQALKESLDGLAHVARIIMAMKEFAHVNAADEAVMTGLNQLVESTVTVSRNEWKYVAEMSMELDENIGNIMCRPGDIKQAVLNLVVNAAQAIGEIRDSTGAKGHLKVSTHRVDDTMVRIDVADDGPGISDEVKKRMFESFFTTKSIGLGSGQGLAIVRKLIEEKSNGKLLCQSVEGVGTVFSIELPIVQDRNM